MLGRLSLKQIVFPLMFGLLLKCKGKKKRKERKKKKKKGWPSQNLLYTAWKELGVAQQGVISVPAVACQGS